MSADTSVDPGVDTGTDTGLDTGLDSAADPLLQRVAAEYGTPAYVFLGDRIETRIGELAAAFGGRFSLS